MLGGQLTHEVEIEVLQWLDVKDWTGIACCREGHMLIEAAGKELVRSLEEAVVARGGYLDAVERQGAAEGMLKDYRALEEKISEKAGQLKKRDIVYARNMTTSALVVQAGSLVIGKPSAFDACQRILFFWDLPSVLIQGPDLLRKLSDPSLAPYLQHPSDHDESKVLTVLRSFVAALCDLKAGLAALQGGVDPIYLDKLRKRFS